MEALTKRRKVALLIGIDYYRSSTIPSLSGAVADLHAFQAYLQDHLNVPEDHITILENETATRDAILEAFRRIANDTRIRRGDAIVIYFAGYGSEAAAPPAWETGDLRANIQLTLPYDVYCKSGDKMVAPIPDRTLSALLQEIAQKKGDNITVIFDSCHSGTLPRSVNDSCDLVRSVPLPSGFQLQGSLDEDIWSLFPTTGHLRSHVRLAACGLSGQAWESEGRGVFTSALLELLEGCQIHKLRYCDVVMRMTIDLNETPICEGFNRERHIFSTVSPPHPEYFIPAYTRTAKNGSITYVLNGGAAHGLVVGDEFAVYPDMESPVSQGTLVIEEIGSFYSVMRPLSRIPIGGNCVAVRIKEAKRRPLHIHIHPGNNAFEILSSLRDGAPDVDFSKFNLVRTPEECDIDIYIQDNQAIFRLKNPRSSQGFCVKPTVEELSRILKASWKFFSNLDCTAVFPDITQHIQVEIYELQSPRSKFINLLTTELFPKTAVPCGSDSLTLRQGSSYGLKLTNNSLYDLYPIVQYFDPSNEFKLDTWYRPACTRSRLDAPLKKDGGCLAIGYGASGSPPLVIPSSDSEGLGFLKISLFSRPLDPFYDVQSFRWARRVPDSHSGPWATFVKPLTLCNSVHDRPPLDKQELAIKLFPLENGLLNPTGLHWPVVRREKKNTVGLSDFKPSHQCHGKLAVSKDCSERKSITNFLRSRLPYFQLKLWNRDSRRPRPNNDPTPLGKKEGMYYRDKYINYRN